MRGRTSTHRNYAAGVGASLIAEAVFIAMVALVSAVRGMDPWMVTRMPASFLYGPAAVQPPGYVAGDVIAGLLMHLMMGIVAGLLYAALLPRLRLNPVTGGVVTGMVLYVLGFWVLPLLFPHRLAPFWLPATEKLLQAGSHLIYGIVFGVAFRAIARPGAAPV